MKGELSEQDLHPAAKELETPSEEHFTFLDGVWNFLFQFSVAAVATFYGIILSLYKFVYRYVGQRPVSIEGKVCFVTGSGRGLGRQLCIELAKKGAILACADINELTNTETVKLINDLGATGKAYKLNVANKQEVEEVARNVEKDLGPVYLVVNNAAIVLPPKEPTEEFVRATFNVNGYYWVVGAFLPYMKARDEGHIVNMASLSAYQPYPHLAEYASTKAAVRSWSESLSMKLFSEKSKIRVTCCFPNFISTNPEIQQVFQLRIKSIPTMQVVEGIMEAIKYGGFGVFTPSYLRSGILLQLLPIEALDFVFRTMTYQVNTLNNDEYASISEGRISRLCSSTTSTEECTKLSGTNQIK